MGHAYRWSMAVKYYDRQTNRQTDGDSTGTERERAGLFRLLLKPATYRKSD